MTTLTACGGQGEASSFSGDTTNPSGTGGDAMQMDPPGTGGTATGGTNNSGGSPGTGGVHEMGGMPEMGGVPDCTGDACDPVEPPPEPQECLPGSEDLDANPTTPCTACAVGDYCPGGLGAGASCEPGEFDHDSDPATACITWRTCSAGTYVATVGSTTLDRVCVPCSASEWSGSENALSCDTWSDCAAGTYVSSLPSATSDRVCIPCEPGEYSASANSAQCVPLDECAPGTYETVPGNETSPPVCDPCPSGFYCAGGQAAPVACTGNTWDGGNPASACVNHSTCAPGTFVSQEPSATQDRLCEVCLGGTYSSSDNAAQCQAWDTCLGTEYESSPGSATADRECSTLTNCGSGEYETQEPTLTTDRECATCPTGYTTQTNATSCTPWTVCSAGEYESTEPTSSTNRVCSTCDDGYYCPGGTTPPTDCATTDSFDADWNPVTACVAWTTCAIGWETVITPTNLRDRACAPGPMVAWGTEARDRARLVVTDRAGYAYVAGDTNGDLAAPHEGWGDVYITKVQLSDLSVVWTRQYGTWQVDAPYDMIMSATGDLLVVGMTGSNFQTGGYQGGTDAFLMRVDPTTGDSDWISQWGTGTDDAAWAVTEDENGDIYVGLNTDGDLDGDGNAGGVDAAITKLSSAGVVQWHEQIGSIYAEVADGIAVDTSGRVTLVGRTTGNIDGLIGSHDVFLWQIDRTTRAENWREQLGTSAYDWTTNATSDSSGNIYVSGYTSGELVMGGALGETDGFLIKVDPSDGSVIWSNQYGGDDVDYIHAVAVDDTHLVAVGTTESALVYVHPFDQDGMLLQIDPATGAQTNVIQWGHDDNDSIVDVALDGSGNAVAVGHTRGRVTDDYQGDYDAHLIHLTLD